ncbi:hypothetical protein AB0P36_35955 [Streptomyces flavidovirens]|uniref:hypothetical protein n=1 Tax=Streptomyces flavidovirens TaxID=67298 RepID=UPI003434B901
MPTSSGPSAREGLAEADRRGFAADVVHCGRGRSVLVGPGAQEVTLLPQHARP